MTKNTLKSFSTEELEAELYQRKAEERKKAEIKRQKERDEEQRIYNLPENVEKRRLAKYNSILSATLASFNGLTEKTVGTWVVKGEDPNCDMGGYHHSPHIGTVEGTLKKAILWAIEQPSFYSWGRGGNVSPAQPKEKVVKL